MTRCGGHHWVPDGRRRLRAVPYPAQVERATGIEPARSRLGISLRSPHTMSLPSEFITFLLTPFGQHLGQQSLSVASSRTRASEPRGGLNVGSPASRALSRIL
jgi:hypothetical protein